MSSDQFRIVIPDPNDPDNPTVVEVEAGSDYLYIDGFGLNQVRIPRDFDLDVWIQLLTRLRERRLKELAQDIESKTIEIKVVHYHELIKNWLETHGADDPIPGVSDSFVPEPGASKEEVKAALMKWLETL